MFRRHRPSAPVNTTPTKPITSPTASNSSPLTTTNSSTPDQRMANGTIVADRYLLERTIGKGSYGKVKLALDLKSRQPVAVKFIARSSIKKPAHTVRIRREINLLTVLNHPNIVRLLEVLETAQDIILVMEYVPGADLFERIVSHPEKRYGEIEGRAIFTQVVAAIEYCHHYRVIHRDLKPENIMVTEDGQVKLIDFGFANMFHPRGYLETNCGSPLYAAPEIVQGIKYSGPEVDIWSLGVILFAILTGTLPFEDEQLKGLYAKICAGNYTIPHYLSAGAKDLIRRMLTVDSNQRLTIQGVATHPWLYSLALPPRSTLLKRSSIKHPPEERVIQTMINFGFPDPEETRYIVSNDPDDPATAIYYLLLAKQQRDCLMIEDSSLKAQPSSILITPPPTPSTKLFPSPGKPSMRPPTVSPLVLDELPSADLAKPLIMAPPLMANGILLNDEECPMEREPLNSSTIPARRVQAGGPGDNNYAGDTDSQATGGALLFSAPASIVSQAAASVANHFKKLRGLAYITRPPPNPLPSSANNPVAYEHRRTGAVPPSEYRPRDHYYRRL